MLTIKDGVKTTQMPSSGELGMVTLGPTVDTSGWMLTQCNLEDHVDIDVGFLDDWRVVLVDDWLSMNWLMIKMEMMFVL